MSGALLLALDVAAEYEPLAGVGGFRALGGVTLVLALVCVLAWLARRGALRLPGSGARAAFTLEASMPLGDRRSLVIVTVEGRRLLLGLTPAQVSLVTELGAREFQRTLDRHAGGGGEA